MGLHDRPYWREEQTRPTGFAGGPPRARTGFGGFPPIGPVTKWLLGLNVALFLVQIFADAPSETYRLGAVTHWLGLAAGGFWQPWRYVTFQFLHGGAWHLVGNMIGVFFLGGLLERTMGSKRYLAFYLSCGAFAGLVYVIVAGVYPEIPDWAPIIGASGGVYALLLAVAVLFPGVRLLLWFVLPVRIRTIAVVIFAVMILTTISGFTRRGAVLWRAMSDVCHLGGAVAGAFWVWVLPRLRGAAQRGQSRIRRGAWDRRMKRKAADQAEVDRILLKIHEQGLASLSEKEKKILRDATRRQRGEERDLYRG